MSTNQIKNYDVSIDTYYKFRNYISHLIDGRRQPNYALAYKVLMSNKSRMQEMYEHFRSDEPYLRDLNRFIDAIQIDTPNRVPALFALYMAVQIVNRRANTLDLNDIETLIHLSKWDKGYLDEAFSFAEIQSLDTPLQPGRFKYFVKLYWCIYEILENSEETREVLENLTRVLDQLVQNLTYSDVKARALQDLAKIHSTRGNISQAKTLLFSIQNVSVRAKSTHDLILYCVRNKIWDIAQAIDEMYCFTDKYWRSMTLATLLQEVPTIRSEWVEEIETDLKGDDIPEKLDIIIAFIGSLLKHGDTEKADIYIAFFNSELGKVRNERTLSYKILELANIYAKTGDFDAALSAVMQVAVADIRLSGLLRLSKYATITLDKRQGLIEQAIGLSNDLSNSWYQSSARISLIELLTLIGYEEDALYLMDLQTDFTARRNSLRARALALAKIEQYEAASQAFLSARSMAFGIPHNSNFQATLLNIIEHLANLDEVETAYKLTNIVKDDTLAKSARINIENIIVHGLEPQVKAVSSNLDNEAERRNADLEEAIQWARVGQFKKALDTSCQHFKLVYQLIVLVNSWAEILEDYQPGLYLSTIRSCAKIAGWIHSDWLQVYEALND